MKKEKYSCKYVLKGENYSSEGILVGTIDDIKKSIKKKFNKNLKSSSNIEFGILVSEGEFLTFKVAEINFNIEDLNVCVSKINHGLEEIEYLIDSTFTLDSYNKIKI